MLTLVAGLVLFLGAHSVRMFADDWRTRTITRIGENPWKGLFSVVAIAGFALVCLGYARARYAPVLLWDQPPVALRHLASLLTLAAFVLLAAGNVPGNRIKAKLRHPMVLSVKVWALSHLLVNNTLADLVLFGSFLLWSVLDFRSARRRDRALATPTEAGSTSRTIIAVVAGVLAWAVFAFWLHRAWIGVSPMGVGA